MNEGIVKTRNIKPYEGNADALGNVLAFDTHYQAWMAAPIQSVQQDEGRFQFWMPMPDPPECDCEDALRSYLANNRNMCATTELERVSAHAFKAGWNFKEAVAKNRVLDISEGKLRIPKPAEL